MSAASGIMPSLNLASLEDVRFRVGTNNGMMNN
jgi:hypothetical protein